MTLPDGSHDSALRTGASLRSTDDDDPYELVRCSAESAVLGGPPPSADIPGIACLSSWIHKTGHAVCH